MLLPFPILADPRSASVAQTSSRKAAETTSRYPCSAQHAGQRCRNTVLELWLSCSMRSAGHIALLTVYVLLAASGAAEAVPGSDDAAGAFGAAVAANDSAKAEAQLRAIDASEKQSANALLISLCSPRNAQ